MEKTKVALIEKTKKDYSVLRSTQTGFASPATHYAEPRIDLNDVLVENPNATFFVRVDDDSFKDFGITQNDVLIIDKSKTPVKNSLALVVKDEEFTVYKFTKKSNEALQIWGVITYIVKSVNA
ncbi:MAG: S24 family peptidase [Chitinophagales bacterium]